MVAVVALLRGVNVGGHGRLAMPRLREVVAACGCTNVDTYIQSGDVVFDVADRDMDALAPAISSALEDAVGFAPGIVLRTREELALLVEENPFLARDEDPKSLHVAFTTAQAEPLLATLDLEKYRPEEASAKGNDVYLFLPNGMGRSKLGADLARKAPTSTARNWRTVTTLLAMADDRS